MKTNVFKNLGMGTIMAASIAACGGEGGDGSIQRGNPQNVAFSDVEFVSPTDGQAGVCPLLTLQIKVKGLENCNLDLNNAIRVYAQGSSPEASNIRFNSLDPRPLPAENKCLLTGTATPQLNLGNIYNIRVFSNMVNGSSLLPNTVSFTTISAGASQSACQTGQFSVSHVNDAVPSDTRNPMLSNLTDFGTIRPDFTVDFSSDAIGMFGSTLGNLILTYLSSLVLPDTYRFDYTPYGSHVQRVEVTQSVTGLGAQSNIRVFELLGFEGGLPKLRQVVTYNYVAGSSGNMVEVHPWDPSYINSDGTRGADTGWSPNTTYLMFVQKSLTSVNGIGLNRSVIKMFRTGD